MTLAITVTDTPTFQDLIALGNTILNALGCHYVAQHQPRMIILS